MRKRAGTGFCSGLFSLAALLAGGCASTTATDFGADPAAVELTSTPFFPQERYQCGPAALMTVLSYSGATVTLDELVANVYLPAREGSLQTEIIAASRRAERIPYRIDGSLASISAELNAGRPVLVLQNLGVSWFPRWHYAVVYGIDPDRNLVRLRSGTDANRTSKAGTFLRTWRRSDNWAIVVLRPDELPANPDRLEYFSSISALEATGHLTTANQAWRTARARWPNDLLPLFGLANTELSQGNLVRAEQHYLELLVREPTHAMARNNLAYTLAGMGRIPEAIQQLETALKLPDLRPAVANELQASLDEISSMRSFSVD
ncbi:MAG TPA: PA2778 family cysteine peptidase [Woeseiaceae bacterium]|nr:PA2778 family cysteine peptidase [Woeseiaceae bacterium]